MLVLSKYGPHRTSYLKYEKPIEMNMFLGGVQFRTFNLSVFLTIDYLSEHL